MENKFQMESYKYIEYIDFWLYLQPAEAKHEALHGAEALEGQLQPDVEEQEHHPQLRQVPHPLHVPHDACAAPTDGSPRGCRRLRNTMEPALDSQSSQSMIHANAFLLVGRVGRWTSRPGTRCAIT